jgi:hydroxymethylbilane synthase
MVNLRGNLNTRLRKLSEEGLDATVLAFAGVERLGWRERITQIIPYDICLPAVGQGSIGVEVRAGDDEILGLTQRIDDHESRCAVSAERALLKKLEGGCQIPVGALGTVEQGRLHLRGVVATLDGEWIIRSALQGDLREAEEIGVRLAEQLVRMGAGEILNQIRLGGDCCR